MGDTFLSIYLIGENMRHPILLCTALFFAVFFSSLSSAGDKPSVFVSILPQKYFVEQIAGDLVNIQVMVKPGASPATYEPKVSQMKKLAVSELYFAVGVPFEQAWLERIAGVNSQMKIVKTDVGIKKLAMEKHLHDDEEDDSHEEHAGDDHENEQGEGLDPHIWLSPQLVKQQATVICASLKELLPEQTTLFETNLTRFKMKIDVLDTELQEIFVGKESLRFMVFHPSWGYFAQNYKLRQVPIEIEGKGPKSSQLRDLILFARAEGIKVIFAQPQFSTKSANLVAREIGGQVVTVDPLAEDWLANMKVVAEKFRDAIQ
ncbi:MAG: zinc transport system substrate-binding protein [Desulforhopalus sp.]